MKVKGAVFTLAMLLVVFRLGAIIAIVIGLIAWSLVTLLYLGRRWR